MDSLLVISNEPALAETLASELPQCAVVHALPRESAAVLQKETFRLVLLDDEDNAATMPATKAAALRLSRPIYLRDLLYTIAQQLQSKTAPAREEITLSPLWRFLPAERLLRASEGKSDIPLTEKEVELLLALLASAKSEQSIPPETLLQQIWGYSGDITTHTLQTHIYRLRGKLRQADESFDIIFAEEGGYRLRLP